MIHALILEIQLRSAEKLDTAPGRDSSETNLGRMAKLFIHSLSIYLPPLICFFEEGDTVHLWQPTHEDKYLATNCVNIESTLIIYTRGLLIQINMEPGTHLSPGVSLISDLAHDSGILQSELFTSRSQNLVLAKLPNSGFWRYGQFFK